MVITRYGRLDDLSVDAPWADQGSQSVRMGKRSRLVLASAPAKCPNSRITRDDLAEATGGTARRGARFTPFKAVIRLPSQAQTVKIAVRLPLRPPVWERQVDSPSLLERTKLTGRYHSRARSLSQCPAFPVSRFPANSPAAKSSIARLGNQRSLADSV